MLNRFEQFTSGIAAITRDVQRIERDEMEKHGLRGAFAQYLLALSHHPEGMTAAALCEACDKDKAAVSRILAEMDNKGLLTRETGASPYRAKLFLTAAGQEAADFVKKRASIAVELAGSGLTDEQRATFYAALELICTNLQTICRDGIPE